VQAEHLGHLWTGRVSVVVPAYNAGRFLLRAVESVRAQTYPAHEIIVVDDGSTDESPDLIQRYIPPVRCFRQENSGAAVARNRGIQEATGNWIAFLDADDYWYPQKLERQVGLLREHPELRWCACGYHVREKGRVFRVDCLDAHDTGTSVMRFFGPALGSIAVHTSGLVIAREVFEQAGYFDPELRLGQDTDLWYRIGVRLQTVGYVREPLYSFEPEAVSRPHRRNFLLRLRHLDRALLLARETSPEIEAEFLAFARPQVLLRLAAAVLRRVETSRDDRRYYMNTFRMPYWQRCFLSLLRAVPGFVAGRAETILENILDPVRMIRCDPSKCPAVHGWDDAQRNS